ncbi:MAG: prepilin peptidase [Acidobacteria bacterium]|nr:MAG: prepilin peptidase [Acidobacteriota bacterium]PYQ88144.1 MAG: prepilin peptidase [Acidobacteriota bacterium]
MALPRTFDPILVSAVAGCGTSGAAIDLWVRRVPNPLTLGIVALGLVLAATHGTGTGIGGALAGLGVGLLLMLPGYVIGATGGGDVKLLAALGTLLGPSAVVMAFFYSAIAGGALAVLVALWRRRLRTTMANTAALVATRGAVAVEIERSSENNRFAYAPAIALGALAAAMGS